MREKEIFRVRKNTQAGTTVVEQSVGKAVSQSGDSEVGSIFGVFSSHSNSNNDEQVVIKFKKKNRRIRLNRNI